MILIFCVNLDNSILVKYIMIDVSLNWITTKWNINEAEGNSLGHRINSFTVGLNIFLDNLWFGLGFGFYGNYIRDTFSNLGYEVGIISSTYNQYLQMLCELGITGFLFFISFIYKSVNQLKKKLKFNFNSNLFIAYIWLFSFFITMQSGNWFLPGSFLFLLVVCLIAVNLKDAK